MKEETIERTNASGSNKEAVITRVKRERNLRLKEWNLAEDDPRTIRPTLQSTLWSMLTTASIHAPNQKPTLRPTTSSIHANPRRENKEQRTEGDHQTTSNPWLSDHHCWTRTIVGPEPSLDHIHREREERIEDGERVVRIKNFFFFNNSGYSELVLIQAHCSSMSKILPFESFDGVAFLVFWC